MKFTKNEIIKIHKMYEHYCKVMDVGRPILTFTREEQKMAVGDRYDDIISDYMAVYPQKAIKLQKRYYDRKDKIFGQTDYKRNGYNDVIYLDLNSFTELRGLHHYSEPTKKKTKYATYIIKHKIGHVEETLIHELVHIKLGPKFRHGKKFDAIVKSIYQNKRFEEW